MKNIFFVIFLCVLSSLSYAQSTIYVSSKSDKRFIAYADSLKKWKDNEAVKSYRTQRLDAAKDLFEYLRICDTLGLVNTDLPRTDDHKQMYSDMNKTTIRYELVVAFHSRVGDLSGVYMPIVLKPTRVVRVVTPKPKPIALSIVASDSTKRLNVRYETIVGDKHYTDSTKTFVFKVCTN